MPITTRVAKNRWKFARALRGHGLEIGALHSPSRLPEGCTVLYSDILTAEQIDRMYPGGRHPDILSDSEHFPTVPDGAFDFVIAHHVLEHLTDPIAALTEWHRILRPGGTLLMAVPDKRFTFDHRRPRTSLQHHLGDHRSALPPSERNRQHLLEWAEAVEGLVPGSEAYETWVDTQLTQGYAVHNHVWVVQDVLRLLLWIDASTTASFALERWSNASPFRNEFVLGLSARSGPLAARERRRFSRALLAAAAAHPILTAAAAAKRLVRRSR